MLPPDLTDLIEFHAPLSVVQRTQGGAVTLLTPGVNVLALNATFLPGDVAGRVERVDLRAVQDWHEAQGLPPLVAWAGAAAPAGLGVQRVAQVWVGDWAGEPEPLDALVRIEQVGRLHLSAWAAALCAAHGTPEWAAGLARQLAAPLEAAPRGFTLLMAYRDGQAVGSLLWQARGPGGAAHLWGALDARAGAALLNAAASLGDGLRVTVPAGWAGLGRHVPVTYGLLAGGHRNPT
ncbi:hypothetical protein [Deinococcus sp.]|uniref:hypothetical protein n=1 Tax=Deinococcus sp. TaxID=47478 RepID=UPI0025B94FFD|nr:hypothetical protein [Deinococcus sp.]